MMDYNWEAIFDDGSTIKQFDENGEEVLFKEVENNIHKLETFKIVSRKGDEYYSVNLYKGIIDLNGKFTNELFRGRDNLKLDFKRRNVVVGNQDTLEVVKHSISYRIGMSDENDSVIIDATPKNINGVKKVEIIINEESEDITDKV